LVESRRFDEALVSCNRAIALQPDYAAAHNNQGIALQELQRLEEALASFDKAIALRPDYAEAHANRGHVLQDLNRHVDALTSYDRAIGLQPGFAETYYDRGTALHDIGRHEEAVASYERAISLRPDFAMAHVNHSLCLWKLGDLSRGWSEYEWRWKTPLLVNAVRQFRQPLWLGQETLAGKTILLHAEQGFGDTLQFCRYAHLAAAQGAHVVLEVQRPLVRLLAGLGVPEVIARGEPLPPFDLQCSLMSLPLAFQTTMETIPAPQRYLASDPVQTAAWRQRLAALPGRRVGLVWAGAPRRDLPDAMAIDRRRPMTLGHLAPLAAVSGVSFVSLQKGETARQTRSPPVAMQVHDFTDELADFADTAALVMALDLVICVDTAVAHLAGALGKPVWILNRFDSCWRWLLDRSDSPWYPTARLFRQPAPGDWGSVIAEVTAALRHWAACEARG
jgi:TPR repeat/Tetratricopeptide repeat/Glycosyltransferase family 9 (heptosyltransferase)